MRARSRTQGKKGIISQNGTCMFFVFLLGASYSGLQYGHATKNNIGKFCWLNEVETLNLYN
jgi:hypothetical protein